MARILRVVSIALLLSALFASGAQAQTINAASCNETDIFAALSSVTTSGTTVVIPAGTCVWKAPLNYAIPSAVTKLTLMGAGSQSIVGGGDQTVIIDHTGSSSASNITIPATTTFRFTSITFKVDSGSTQTTNGMVAFGGTGVLRWDHSHLWNSGGPVSECLGIVYGAITGVFDHNIIDMPVGQVNNGVRVGNGQTAFGDASGNANLSWSNPTSPGTASGYFFFEDNVYNGSISNDCNNGGRQVFRHNTFNQSSVQTHEMEGDGRGCRATEVYQNNFNGMIGDTITSFTALGCRMGTCLVWGNSLSLIENLTVLQNDRTNGHPFLLPPNGYGFCGTLGVDPGPSNWDGNSTTTSGYPCLDQPARGQSDVLSGNFPNKCDASLPSTTPGACGSGNFKGVWPHNKLEPVYEWLNQIQIGQGNGWVKAAIGPIAPFTGAFTQNVDYFDYTLSWNGSSFTGTPFNGTVGTGSGLLSARPSTCTAGPGGPFGASPTGSFGVAYWATDTTTLYICTATNTWTSYYIPFQYPHPLVVNTPVGIPPTTPQAIPH